MEWWHVFRRVRKVVFGESPVLAPAICRAQTHAAFLAILSLLWAIALSVYLAHEWKHFDLIQREFAAAGTINYCCSLGTRGTGIIILGMIALNGFTSLLLYLM